MKLGRLLEFRGKCRLVPGRKYIYIYIYILRIHFLDGIERDRFDCKLTSSRNGLFGRRENTKIEVAFDIHDGQCKDDGFDLVAMVG